MRKWIMALLAISMFSTAQAAIDTETTTEYRDDDTVYQRSFNVRMQPLPTVIGMPTLSVHFAVSDTISLGLGGMVMTSDEFIKDAIEASDPFFIREEYSISASAVEARADIALDGDIMGDTYYFSPAIQSMTLTVEDNFLNTSGTADIVLAKATIGHQWMWEHFNINLAGGLTTALSESYSFENISRVDDEDVESIGTGFALEFGLGVAF